MNKICVSKKYSLLFLILILTGFSLVYASQLLINKTTSLNSRAAKQFAPLLSPKPKSFSPPEIIFFTDNEIKSFKSNHPYGDRVYIVPETGTVYTREFDINKNGLNSYKRLDTFGLLTLPGETKNSWNNTPKFEGIELMHVWKWGESPPELLNSLDNAHSAGIRVLPDIKYALTSRREKTNEGGLGNGKPQYEEYFDRNKFNILMEKYPGTIIGFTFDDPHPDTHIYIDSSDPYLASDLDYQKFASDYAKNGGSLPINVIEWGMLSSKTYLSDEKTERISSTRSYVSTLRNTLKQNAIPVFGGTFSYPFIYKDTTTDLMISALVSDWQREYIRDNATPSWFVLAAHDTGEDSTNEDPQNAFENLVDVGKGLPFMSGANVSGDVKAHLFQIIAAVATNPTYSRFSWWNWPNNGKSNPYAKSMPGIVNAIKLLGPARFAINGKVDNHDNKDLYSYTVKSAVSGKLPSDYKVAFIHIKRDMGYIPPVKGLKGNTTYIDILSKHQFFAGNDGVLTPRGTNDIKKNSVFCLVEIE